MTTAADRIKLGDDLLREHRAMDTVARVAKFNEMLDKLLAVTSSDGYWEHTEVRLVKEQEELEEAVRSYVLNLILDPVRK